MERSCQIFNKLGLKGSFTLGHLDPKHMLIRLNQEADFNRIRLRDIWYIDDFQIRIFRWSMDFHPDVESSITLVLIALLNLPIFLFDKNVFFNWEPIWKSPEHLCSDNGPLTAKCGKDVC